MKTINSLIVVCSLILFISCKAQQQFPLNYSVITVPNNSQLKDTNNELDFYVGTWTANLQNKTIKLVVTKHLNFPFIFQNKTLYKDLLIVKYETIINGILIQQSTMLNNIYTYYDLFAIVSMGTENDGNIVNLRYNGTNCGVGAGTIDFTKISNNQLNWKYTPYHTTVTEECSPNADLNIYLPETDNLIFTKQ